MYVTRKEKVTECQKCKKYTVPVPVTKWIKQCNPVFDEKCKTTYLSHCKSEQRCVMIYQTVCNPGYDGYGQHCSNEVRGDIAVFLVSVAQPLNVTLMLKGI